MVGKVLHHLPFSKISSFRAFPGRRKRKATLEDSTCGKSFLFIFNSFVRYTTTLFARLELCIPLNEDGYTPNDWLSTTSGSKANEA